MFRSALVRHSKTIARCGRLPTAVRHLAAAAGGAELAALSQTYPHMDVVKYEHKNRVWTLNHVNYYSEALAVGLMEVGLQPGNTVLSWLPAHFSEQMVLQFACSKAGLVLYSLDPALAKTDPEASKQALAKALEITQASVLVSQESGDDVNYIRLAEQVIPELRIFHQNTGAVFVTPRFPHLRLPIHTGFDRDEKEGWIQLRHMVVPSDTLDQFVDPNKVTASTPLAGTLELDNKGIPKAIGKAYTNEQVIKEGLWPTYCNILQKKFHAVEGVGVIF